jgi:hypothetical protein
MDFAAFRLTIVQATMAIVAVAAPDRQLGVGDQPGGQPTGATLSPER